jgi:type IV secretory pathway VirB3-like protein
VERKEPRAFRLMYLWLITKASCHPHIRKFWGGATREPLPFRHQKESKRH